MTALAPFLLNPNEVVAWDDPVDPAKVDGSVSNELAGSLFDFDGEHGIGFFMRKLQEIFDAAFVFPGTGGTTLSNWLAIHTMLLPNQVVAVERDVHVSVIKSIIAIGARPLWLVPPFDPELGINLSVTPEQVKGLLKRYRAVRGVIVTHPKYYGNCGDIAGVAAACRDAGVPLMVDQAHGSTLPFHPSALPISATDSRVRAAFSTQSPHKETETSAQGSLLFIDIADERWGSEWARRFQVALNGIPGPSTSHSFPILVSLEQAVTKLHHIGPELLDAAIGRADWLRHEVGRIDGLRTWGRERCGVHPGFVDLSPTRVTVDVSRSGLTGFEVEAKLQASHLTLKKVVAEFGDLRNVLFLVTYGTTDDDIATTVARLRHIVETERRPSEITAPSVPQLLPTRRLSPRAAFLRALAGDVERIRVEEAIGRVSAECIGVFPPGNAIIVHGETITEEVVAYLTAVSRPELGAHLKGASSPHFETINVIRMQ